MSEWTVLVFLITVVRKDMIKVTNKAVEGLGTIL